MVLVPLVPRPLGRLPLLLSARAQAYAPSPAAPPPTPTAPTALPAPPGDASEDEQDAALVLRFGYHV